MKSMYHDSSVLPGGLTVIEAAKALLVLDLFALRATVNAMLLNLIVADPFGAQTETAAAVKILREELGPKYARIVEKRAAARAIIYAYRATPEGQRKRREYARKYYRENREKCNAASTKCRKRRQAAKAGNSKTTKAEA